MEKSALFRRNMKTLKQMSKKDLRDERRFLRNVISGKETSNSFGYPFKTEMRELEDINKILLPSDAGRVLGLAAVPVVASSMLNRKNNEQGELDMNNQFDKTAMVESMAQNIYKREELKEAIATITAYEEELEKQAEEDKKKRSLIGPFGVVGGVIGAKKGFDDAAHEYASDISLINDFKLSQVDDFIRMANNDEISLNTRSKLLDAAEKINSELFDSAEKIRQNIDLNKFIKKSGRGALDGIAIGTLAGGALLAGNKLINGLRQNSLGGELKEAIATIVAYEEELEKQAGIRLYPVTLTAGLIKGIEMGNKPYGENSEIRNSEEYKELENRGLDHSEIMSQFRGEGDVPPTQNVQDMMDRAYKKSNQAVLLGLTAGAVAPTAINLGLSGAFEGGLLSPQKLVSDLRDVKWSAKYNLEALKKAEGPLAKAYNKEMAQRFNEVLPKSVGRLGVRAGLAGAVAHAAHKFIKNTEKLNGED